MSRPRSGISRSEPLHQQVARQIRNDIEAGVLRDGQRLPSTRELAEEWDVSGYTVNEAMDLLIKEGLVLSKSRAGRVVNAPDQAQRREPPTTTPQVLLIGGYAGSGKTELGRILARETGWPILDKDSLTRAVLEAALEVCGKSPHDRESELYVNTMRPREYEALASAMMENLECGNSAIVTAPFIKEFADTAWISRMQARCSAVGATVHVVWVHCDAETMHTYVRHRGAARDTAKLVDWDSYLASIDIDFRPNVPHFLIDNSASSDPLQPQAREVIAKLAEADAEQ